MSMYHDIDWSKVEENFNKCLSNSTEVKDYAHRFQKGHWSFMEHNVQARRKVESISRGDDAYFPRKRTFRSSEQQVCWIEDS